MSVKIFSGKRITLTLVLTLIVVNLSLWFSHVTQAEPKAMQTETATVLQIPRAINPFTLVDTHGKLFKNPDLNGHWTLMFFGFTRCATICPATMATLKQVYEKVAADKNTLPKVVFISIDPARDNLSRIQQFVTAFNPSFTGITGSKAQIDQLAEELGVLYLKMAPASAKNDQDYQIDHSGTILLFDPKGQFCAVFSMPHDAGAIARDYENIVKQYS